MKIERTSELECASCWFTCKNEWRKYGGCVGYVSKENGKKNETLFIKGEGTKRMFCKICGPSGAHLDGKTGNIYCFCGELLGRYPIDVVKLFRDE